MNRGRLFVRILAFAALAALAAIVLIIVVGPAGASWSGEPLPAWGDDWYIDEDTWYEDENIDLSGYLTIDGGVKVELVGCTLTFDQASGGDYGIDVDWGELYLKSSANNRMTVKSSVDGGQWYFNVNDWKLYMEGTDLYDLVYGIQYYPGWYSSDPEPLTIDDCTIMSKSYGVYSSYDTYISDSYIDVAEYWWNAVGVYSEGPLDMVGTTITSYYNIGWVYSDAYVEGCELYGMYAFECYGDSFDFIDTIIGTDYTSLYAYATTSYIEGCTVTSEYETGIYAGGDTFTIIDCTVTSVYSSIDAGATTNYIEGCTLQSEYDVGIYAGGTTTTIEDCDVSGSYAAVYSYSNAYIGNSTLYSPDNMAIYGSSGSLYIEGCEVRSRRTGIMTYCDSHIGNTTVDVLYKSDVVTGLPTLYGIYASGKKCFMNNLDISVAMDVNGTYNTSSMSVYTYVYGLYLNSANIGMLGDDIRIDLKNHVDVHNYYVTSYVYIRFYIYTYGVYMTGNTICTAIDGTPITIDESFYGAPYNASMYGYVYFYNYQRYIYSSIGSTGKAPLEVRNLAFDGLRPVLRTGGRANRIYPYFDSRYLFYFNDNKDSRPADSVVVFTDITVTDSIFGYVLYLPPNQDLEVTDCTFHDMEAYYVIYSNGLQKAWTIFECNFTRVSAIANPRYNGRPFIYIYGAKGVGQLANCTFDGLIGTSMLYLRYQADRTVIEYNTIINCLQWKDTSDNWFYIDYNSDKVEVRLNTFRGNDARYFMGLYYNTKRMVLEDNDFTVNRAQDWLLRVYQNNEETDINMNLFESNTGNMVMMDYTYRQVNFEKNTVTHNAAGAGYLMRTTYTQNALRLADNEVNNNTADGAMFYFIGPTYWYWPGYAAFAVDRNVFSDNVASSAINGGIIVIRGARYDTPVRRNEFYNNVGNCINFYRPYYYGTYDTTYTFTVDGNYFEGNRDPATIWVDISTYNVVVKRNTGRNNAGLLVKTVFTAHYVYDTSMQPYFYGEVRGPYTLDVDYNTWTHNTGGGIDIRAMWHDMYTIGSLIEQQVSVRNNDLTWNTGGYCIKIVDFGAAPLLINNDFTGSEYGVFLQAIDYRYYWPRLQLAFNGESFDGGVNGVTAWALVNGDADFTNCKFENYREAVYVKDGTINVLWSAIPETSGRTEGRGYIYVYNHLEINVTWSDINGVDSGKPAAGATVAMMGANGRYFDKMTTNEMGRLGPMVVQPWTCVEGRMDAWSPLSTTVLSGGLTGIYVINLIGEKVGADAAHLVIQDTVAPAITVTAPSEGSISNLLDMPVEGFLFETGSGVSDFRGWIDSGVPRDIAATGVWATLFAGLAPGDHTLWLELSDLAGNGRTMQVLFTIDAAAPVMILTSPEDGLITAEPAIEIRGTFSDDLSDLVDIVVRINANRVNPGTPGVLLEPFTLTEGVNAITIDATDAAGNKASVTLTVTLDTYPPTLYVYNPLDRLLTPDDLLTVDGLSDANTVITIEVMQFGVVKDEETVVARSDGTFVAAMTLLEGSQTIIVTAKDSPANNVKVVSRVVTLDTTAPALVIDSPTAEVTYFRTATLQLIGHIEDPTPDKVVVKVNGKPVVHSGTFTVALTLVEGPNAIVVTAEDEVGNIATQTLNVIRDTVRPELDVEVPAFLLTNEAELLLRGDVNKDAIKVEVRGTEVSVDENGQFHDTLDLSTEPSPLVVVATDLAGNTATYTIDFIYDGTDPTLDLDPVVSQTSDVIAFINGSVDDDKSAIDHVLIKGNPFPVVDGRFMAIIDLSTTGDGWNNFTVVAEDEAGNLVTRYVSIHWQPPAAHDGGDDDGGPSNEALSWIGVVLLAAGITLVLTAWFLSKGSKKEEDQ